MCSLVAARVDGTEGSTVMKVLPRVPAIPSSHEGRGQEELLRPFATLEDLNQPAGRQHGDAVTEQHQFFHLARNDHDALTATGEVFDQMIQGEFRRDINASSRLVEQDDFGSRMSQRPITTFCWLPPLSCPTG